MTATVLGILGVLRMESADTPRVNYDEEKRVEIFKKFLKKCYWDDILELSNEYPDVKSLLVDYRVIEGYNRDVAYDILNRPSKMISAAERALREMDLPTEKIIDNAHVRITNCPDDSKFAVRDLRTCNIGKLVTVTGLVQMCSQVHSWDKMIAYECLRCGHITHVPQQGSTKQDQPFAGCENETCGKKGPFKIVHDECESIDLQNIMLQEPPEDAIEGGQPKAIKAIAIEDIAGAVQAGNRVELTGILKKVYWEKRGGTSNVSEFVLEVNSIRYLDKGFQEIEIRPDDVDEIKKLSQDPDIYEKFAASIAPAIYGYEGLKEALVLQLFTGVRIKKLAGTTIRGDINILMIGDPGIAKSQMLQAVAHVAPRAMFASGRGASEAGLTAAVVKNQGVGDNDGFTVQAGVLALTNDGIACIDEFDKMRKEDQNSIHSAMEQQIIAIDKGGIHMRLPSVTSVLAAANPKHERFDKYESLSTQLNMGPALLSRFDLIFILIDEPNQKRDGDIGNHILDTHEIGERYEEKRALGAYGPNDEIKLLPDEATHIKPVIVPEMVRKYVAYSRKHIIPKLTPEARMAIYKFYMSVRKLGEGGNAPVPITPRQLESLIRLAEASARVRLSTWVEKSDAIRAIKQMENYLKTVGMDPETGEYDIDIVEAGTSKSQRDKINILRKLLIELKGLYNNKIPIDEFVEKARENGISGEQLGVYLEKMLTAGDIFKPEQNMLGVVSW